MKHVGDALGDTIVQARNNIVTIGIAPWGVVHKNTDLIGQDVIDYSFITLALISNLISSLQCFDAVGWAAGRASGL